MKTNNIILISFINNKPSLVNISTTGLPNYFSTYQLTDGSLVNVNILDTTGQEKFDALNESYYKKADCVLLVYDITNKKSFDKCKNYYNPKLRENCKKNIKVILLGNKADLNDNREIEPEEGAAFAVECNYIFMETSCLENTNVASAFATLIEITNIEAKKIQENNIDLNTKKKKKSFC